MRRGEVLLKAIEEMAELTQILAKMEFIGGTDYWYGVDLKPALIEEFGDVRAILGRLFSELDEDTRNAITRRQIMKSNKYKEWWDDNSSKG